MDKDWCAGECFLQDVEGFSGCGVPRLGHTLEKIGEWTGDGTVVMGEPVVEDGESKESL